MSDRNNEEFFLTRLRLVLAAGHTAAYDLRADISELLNERRAVLAAAPVEPVPAPRLLDAVERSEIAVALERRVKDRVRMYAESNDELRAWKQGVSDALAEIDRLPSQSAPRTWREEIIAEFGAP